MKITSIAAIGATLLAASLMTQAVAGEIEARHEDRIKASVAANTKGKVTPETVAPSPVPGVFEVTTGHEVFYVDTTGRYAFVEGRLVDLVNERDLTALTLDRLTRVDFGKLPLELAVKEIRGKGTRVLAIFEDPGCPVCRSLHKFIAQLPDVTVYHYMLPLTDPQSIPRARQAWCSSDRRAAWLTLMRGGSLPAGTASCDASGLARIAALADQLHIQGTPTVVLANGRRMVGATPPDQFVAALDELGRPTSR